MKKKVFLYIFLLAVTLFSCSDDDVVHQVEEPSCEEVYLNTFLEPQSCPLTGGTFTVTVTGCWNQTGPADCIVSVYKIDPPNQCLADRQSGDIVKNIQNDFTFNTNNFPYSNCTGAGYNYKIEIVTLAETRTHNFSWNSSIAIIDAKVEKGIMTNVANFGPSAMNNTIISATSTFRNPISDASVDIINQPNNNNEGWEYDGINFEEDNEEDLEDAIEAYVFGPPSIHVDPQNYPFLLVYANYAGVVNSLVRYMGFSNNVNRPFLTANSNYSLVFVGSIRGFCSDFNPPKNFTSVLNMVTPHELIHQIGNVWTHGEHSNDQPSCVLNDGRYFTLYTTNFNQLTSKYVICSSHISDIRDGLGGDLKTSSNKSIVSNTNVTGGRFAFNGNSLVDINPKVNISLPKKNYKQFEPIQLEFEWINSANRQDTIWALFESLKYIKYVITDSTGTRVDKPLNSGLHIVMSKPAYILEPGDSVKRSMTINHFGQTYSNFKEGRYFHNSSYFPIGKYKIHAIIDEDLNKKYEMPIVTNEVEFEISELDETDKKVLEQVKLRKYDLALETYPSNYFQEYLLYFSLINEMIKLIKAEQDNKEYSEMSELIYRFKHFFDSYPNSVYNLNYVFLSHYFSLNNKSKGEMVNDGNRLLNSYPNSRLEYTVRDMLKRNRFMDIKSRK